jgi:hypothetical protein
MLMPEELGFLKYLKQAKVGITGCIAPFKPQQAVA